MREGITYHSYGNGHPWYYLLGGPVLSPRTILEDAKASDYCGYNRDNIAKADTLPEPKRSEALRALYAKHLADLKSDISIYRRCVRDLSSYRKNSPEVPVCEDVHVNMGLKISHMVNDFAHLIWIEELLSKQGDLFG